MPKSKIVGHNLIHMRDIRAPKGNVLRLSRCECGLLISQTGGNERQAQSMIDIKWNKHLRRVGQIG